MKTVSALSMKYWSGNYSNLGQSIKSALIPQTDKGLHNRKEMLMLCIPNTHIHASTTVTKYANTTFAFGTEGSANKIKCIR